MTSGSMADAAPALIVHQVGQCNPVTGAITYRATVGDGGGPFALSFTRPRDGVVADLGYGMFRYTPSPRVNADSDSFTVIADDGRGGSLDSTVTWINDNHVPVVVAPPRLSPPDPASGAVTVSPNIVDPDGDWLTFTLDAPFPRRGAVTIDWDGTFTYVPFLSERDDTAVGEETLGFRAVDPRGASAYITVTVPISPRHIGTPPDPRSAMGLPDPETGVVTGSCGHTGAGYTYAASAAAKGTVVIDAATGIWAYRPAAAARHEAVADGASMAERHDNFTVTVSNGKRDKVVVPVSVPLVSMKAVASYAVTAEIALGVVPAGLAVSPRGDQVYVTSFVDEAAVTVIRTADNAISRIPLTFRPEGVVVGPNGRHLYVADAAGRRVAVIDTIEHTTAFVGVGDHPFHMAVLGADLYVANNQDGTVSVIDTIDNIVVRTARHASVVDTDVANDPPKLTITEVGYHVFHVSAEDPDNDPVTYTATQPFCGTVSDLGDGLFQYTPNAGAAGWFVDHFAITADDGHGGVVTETVALTV